jgi:hypothetical protein
MHSATALRQAGQGGTGGVDGHGHELAGGGAKNPVVHVVRDSLRGGQGRRELARGDDSGTTLLDAGDELVGVPGLILDHLLGRLACQPPSLSRQHPITFIVYYVTGTYTQPSHTAH